MNRPDVSVLMAARNAIVNYPLGMLSKAVFSTVLQKGVAVEMCVCDDGSEDDTDEYLRRMDVRASAFTNRTGPAMAYHGASRMATGRYCIVQSVRSWYEPGAFARMVKALDDNPDIGFVYGATQYHGARDTLYKPPPFERGRFWRHFDSLFGYMYRREALDAGCQYVGYLDVDGQPVDICDYDFVMQLIAVMGWNGLALPETTLNYYYSGAGQQTNLVHKYQREIDEVFRQRWGASEAVFNANRLAV